MITASCFVPIPTYAYSLFTFFDPCSKLLSGIKCPRDFSPKNKTLTKILTNGIAKVPTGYELPGFFFLNDFGDPIC